MKINQRGITNIVALIILLIILAMIIYYLMLRQNPSYTPPQILQKPQSQTIQNEADLMNASKDLDITNIDSLDSEMSQLDTDASGM